ncbi:MAG: hypothetical protein LBT04_05405 [Prevotellaceae bacterium]|jgi:hypothetical protein|nr:hypothetical protein [Prevotellaceae bacterium]
MNLFFKKLFGGFETAEKMEAKEKQLIADFLRYRKFAESDTYQEYQKLFEVVKSADFKENKKTLKNRKYSDTQEYLDMREYKKLVSNGKLHAYFKTLKSKELVAFLNFKDTEDYLKLGNKLEVRKSPTLQIFKKFEKSDEYRNYARFHNSVPVSEYENLKEKIFTEEFKKSNAFWADKNRWEKTEQYAIEQTFFKIVDSEEGKFFFSTDPKKFEEIAKQQLIVKDNFKWKNLDESKWEAGFCYANKNLKSVHSFLNELQANAGGKNIHSGNALTISTKHQKTKSAAWDTTKGFVEKEYNFSSDIINGHNFIEQPYSLIRAKIRFEGSPVHAFWLSGGEKLPHINIAKTNGKRTIEAGVYDYEGKYCSTKISGLNLSNYHIFSLYCLNNELIWKINNLEVFRTKHRQHFQNLFPVFNSFIPDKKHASAGRLQVDWVEVYNIN